MKRVTVWCVYSRKNYSISIHTLCEEGDKRGSKRFRNSPHFNPHPLWRGWRYNKCGFFRKDLFQSTPSVKRVTIITKKWIYQMINFNPHPLWRGWPFVNSFYGLTVQFQSTPSVKRVTQYESNIRALGFISIHTLCEEGDTMGLFRKGKCYISIHTLCEEGDISKRIFSYKASDFNPHPLWRGWRCKSYSDCLTANISIHTLCEEGDRFQNVWKTLRFLFQSTPSVKRVT